MYQPSLKPETSEDYSWEWGGFPRRAPSVEDANVPGFPSPSSPEDDAVPRTRTISLQNSAATPTPAPAHLHATLARALTLPPTSNQPPHFPHRIKSYPPADGLHSSDGELSIEGRLENHEEDPYKFTLDMTEGGSDEMSAGQPRRHHFELSLCGDEGFGDESRSVSLPLGQASAVVLTGPFLVFPRPLTARPSSRTACRSSASSRSPSSLTTSGSSFATAISLSSWSSHLPWPSLIPYPFLSS